jgi:hypothetical protein
MHRLRSPEASSRRSLAHLGDRRLFPKTDIEPNPMQKSNSRDGDGGSLGRRRVLACGCDAATVHRREDVRTREFHKIWTEQCEATQDIRLRYGPQAAFDYVVAEKLLNFAEAAAHRPEFARELPRFVARVRELFTPEELETHIARIEHERMVQEALSPEIEEEDSPFRESLEAATERGRQFSTIKELLTAAHLGTS